MGPPWVCTRPLHICYGCWLGFVGLLASCFCRTSSSGNGWVTLLPTLEIFFSSFRLPCSALIWGAFALSYCMLLCPVWLLSPGDLFCSVISFILVLSNNWIFYLFINLHYSFIAAFLPFFSLRPSLSAPFSPSSLTTSSEKERWGVCSFLKRKWRGVEWGQLWGVKARETVIGIMREESMFNFKKTGDNSVAKFLLG